MRSFSYRLTTPAAPDRVIGHLADLRHLESWVAEVRDVRVEGEAFLVRMRRTLAPGVVFRYVVETDRAAGTVVATGEHRSMLVIDRWSVRPADGGGSAVEYLGEYELRGPSRLLGPLSQLLGRRRAPSLGRALGEQLDRLT